MLDLFNCDLLFLIIIHINVLYFQTCQDEALLSDWKQQLDLDIETMKAHSNVVMLRSVSLFCFLFTSIFLRF